MDIKWKCDGCGQPLITDSKHAGAEVECPKCKKTLVAPSSQALQEEKKPIELKVAVQQELKAQLQLVLLPVTKVRRIRSRCEGAGLIIGFLAGVSIAIYAWREFDPRLALAITFLSIGGGGALGHRLTPLVFLGGKEQKIAKSTAAAVHAVAQKAGLRLEKCFDYVARTFKYGALHFHDEGDTTIELLLKELDYDEWEEWAGSSFIDEPKPKHASKRTNLPIISFPCECGNPVSIDLRQAAEEDRCRECRKTVEWKMVSEGKNLSDPRMHHEWERLSDYGRQRVMVMFPGIEEVGITSGKGHYDFSQPQGYEAYWSNLSQFGYDVWEHELIRVHEIFIAGRKTFLVGNWVVTRKPRLPAPIKGERRGFYLRYYIRVNRRWMAWDGECHYVATGDVLGMLPL